MLSKAIQISKWIVVFLALVSPFYASAAMDDADLFKQDAEKAIDDFRPRTTETKSPEQPETEPSAPVIQLTETDRTVESGKYVVTGIVTDQAGVALVEVNGREAGLDASGGFSAEVLLVVGINTITVKATNLQHVVSETELLLTRILSQETDDVPGSDVPEKETEDSIEAPAEEQPTADDDEIDIEEEARTLVVAVLNLIIGLPNSD